MSLLLHRPSLQAQEADLSVDFTQFAPTLLSPGDNPTGLRFTIFNLGFDDFSGDVTVEVML